MGNMPEMETNHVKAEQVGLASGGRVRVFHLTDLLPSHCYLMWIKEHWKRRQKGSP